MNQKVYAIKKDIHNYPSKDTLFRPSVDYPEYVFKGDISKVKNEVYDLFREGLILQGLDAENYGGYSWNPFGAFIKPGNRVLIKPNLVMHKNVGGGGEDCLYTNPSVVAAIVDYVVIALKGKGKIVIGDAPLQECVFDDLIDSSGYGDLVSYYKKKRINIEIVDFRNVKTYEKNGVHYLQQVTDVENGIVVELGEDSLFAEKTTEELKRLRITNYDPSILQKHHNNNKHEYKISKEVIGADVIINVPKPKTHRKAGVTAALKNLIGINANKEFLPHHTLGGKKSGGDAYKDDNMILSAANYFLDKRNITNAKGLYERSEKLNKIYEKLRSVGVRKTGERFWEGSWYGNDTIWRTIVDLNRIMLYADKTGKMTDRVQRKVYIVGDMIVSGEKEGPLEPSPKKVGTLLFAEDPVLFDRAVTAIMGYDERMIPLLNNDEIYKGKYAFDKHESVNVVSNYKDWNNDTRVIASKYGVGFIPCLGWMDLLGKEQLDNDFKSVIEQEKPIIIWGAADRGIYVAEYLLQHNRNVYGFCDKNPKKQGKSVLANIRCFSPERIDDSFYVIVTTRAKFNSEIKKILEKKNITSSLFWN